MATAAQAGFTQVPNSILRDARLSMQARLLYGLLQSYAWQKDNSWPGQERLAAEMGLSERQVRIYLRELENAGLVEVQHRGQTTNNYLLREAVREDWKPTSAQSQTDRKPTSAQSYFDRKSTSAQSRKPTSAQSQTDRKPTSYEEDSEINTQNKKTQTAQVQGEAAKDTLPYSPVAKPNSDKDSSGITRAKAFYKQVAPGYASNASNMLEVEELARKYGPVWFERAYQAMMLRPGKKPNNWAYLAGILRGWKDEGRDIQGNKPVAVRPFQAQAQAQRYTIRPRDSCSLPDLGDYRQADGSYDRATWEQDCQAYYQRIGA